MPEQLSAEDRLAIMDLIADYADRLEAGDLDGFVDNFTPEGVLKGNNVTHEGREAIRAFVARLYEIGQDGPDGNRHFLCMPKLKPTAEGCRAQTYFLIPAEAGPDSVNIRSMAVYVDDIVRHEGRWRFRQRYLNMLARRSGGL